MEPRLDNGRVVNDPSPNRGRRLIINLTESLHEHTVRRFRHDDRDKELEAQLVVGKELSVGGDVACGRMRRSARVGVPLADPERFVSSVAICGKLAGVVEVAEEVVVSSLGARTGAHPRSVRRCAPAVRVRGGCHRSRGRRAQLVSGRRWLCRPPR